MYTKHIFFLTRSGLLTAAMLVLGLAQAQGASPSPPPAAAAQPANIHAEHGDKKDGQTQATLSAIEVQGSSILTAGQWQAELTGYLQRRHDGASLLEIKQHIQRVYDEAGLTLTQVSLPGQNLTAGQLTVQVVEPVMGELRIVQAQEPALQPVRVEGLFDYVGLKKGQPLYLPRLERVLFAVNDMPGVAARSVLSPRDKDGVFDVVVELESHRRWELSADLDNHGNEATGQWRAGLFGRLNNPLGIGDNFDLRVLRSDRGRLDSGRVAYELPVAYTPWRATVALSRTDYSLGGQPFGSLQAHGVSDRVEFGLTLPVIRSRARNLIFSLGADRKALTDKIDAFWLETRKRSRNFNLGLSFENRDTLGGGGYTGAQLQLQSGRLSFSTPDARVADANLGHQATQGAYHKINYQLSRLQTITDQFLFYVAISGQYGSKNLDGSEKLLLGGPSGVRAFPAAEAASDQGYIVRLEGRYSFTPAFTGSIFYDWARGQARRRASSADLANTRIISGLGLGLNYYASNGFNFKATAAWRQHGRVLSEPQASGPTLYVQLQYPF